MKTKSEINSILLERPGFTNPSTSKWIFIEFAATDCKYLCVEVSSFDEKDNYYFESLPDIILN